MTQQKKNNQLEAFHEWLYSLSWEELLNAMEFIILSGDDGSGTEEWELTQDMIRMQLPPPNPIHPRAVTFRVASLNGVTDGRSEEDRRKRDRFLRPRLLQWSEQTLSRHGPGANSKNRRQRGGKGTRVLPKRFMVVARKFVTPGGDRLSLGATSEVQQAEETLLRGTVLRQALSTSTVVAKFNGSLCKNECAGSPKALLRVLKVASRGNFGTTVVPSQNSATQLYAGPWLHPTDRWFSLSMYLANRFELALWDAFRDRRTSSLASDLDSISKVTENQCRRAVVHAMRQMLLDGSQELHNVDRLSLRDGQLWNLFSEDSSRSLTFGSGLSTVSGILHCPLVDWFGSGVQQLRKAVREALHDQNAKDMQELLLRDLDIAEVQPQAEPVKKLKKAKRKGRQRRHQPKVPSTIKEEKATVKGTSEVEGVSSDGEGEETKGIQHGSPYDFPLPCRSMRQRSRNTIMALSIIEDVMESVFLKVGLERTSSFEPEPESTTEVTKQANTASNIMGSAKKTSTTHAPSAATLKSPDPPTKQKVPKGDAVLSNETAVGDDSLWPFGSNDFFLHADSGPLDFDNDLNQAETSSQLSTTTEYKISQPRNEPLSFDWSFPDEAFERMRSFSARENSILADFFLHQEQSEALKDDRVMASSTAASIGSVSDKEAAVKPEVFSTDTESGPDDRSSGDYDLANSRDYPTSSDGEENIELSNAKESNRALDLPLVHTVPEPPRTPSPTKDRNEIQSLSPPATPSPTLSPILVSLSDLSEMRKETLESLSNNKEPKARAIRSLSLAATSSLPGSPARRRLVSSLSRENLKDAAKDLPVERASLKSDATLLKRTFAKVVISRDDTDIKSRATVRRSVDALSSYRKVSTTRLGGSRDDTDIKHVRAVGPKSADALRGYRNAAARSLTKSASSVKTSTSEISSKPFSHLQFESTPVARKDTKDQPTQSFDGNDHWLDKRPSFSQEDGDNNTITRDGSTTITSALSQRESGDTPGLREERDTYRDMCLTLGAEVAKLKNMLAAQFSTVAQPPFDYTHGPPMHVRALAFDPESVVDTFHIARRPQTLAAMSDAGYRAEYESHTSEDELAGKVLRTESSRLQSSSTTIAGSDVSVDRNPDKLSQIPIGVSPARDVHGPVSLHGLQSRLTTDILRFLGVSESQLLKQDSRKRSAVERMTRLVKTVWPRAQVKLYGSHVTGLCLPSSDLDFVVCLPAVHKNDVAVAPGVLEGRNAINETSQKLLARKLKSESWIDTRSMKLIERTVVPVIKVSTKDTKARTLQLDITFDGPQHHGLQAVQMVKQIMEDLPMIRALVLVLKQFLIDRGLLTAYTGGLSSYCLFLMVARYLQEQPSAWGDCGSLLMGFLDFYGNHFDPRSTGISVRRQQYFLRPNYLPPPNMPNPSPLWTPDSQVQPNQGQVGVAVSFIRRSSLSDKQSVDGVGVAAPFMAKQGNFRTRSRYPPPVMMQQNDPNSFDHGRPYTFDPLFVEDPLSEGNNVGRNAFRINQVQRAFSDAHRALVAALEWDLQSDGDLQEAVEYPLLKCMLQNEDLFIDP